jgi:hypothetical protein
VAPLHSQPTQQPPAAAAVATPELRIELWRTTSDIQAANAWADIQQLQAACRCSSIHGFTASRGAFDVAVAAGLHCSAAAASAASAALALVPAARGEKGRRCATARPCLLMLPPCMSTHLVAVEPDVELQCCCIKSTQRWQTSCSKALPKTWQLQSIQAAPTLRSLLACERCLSTITQRSCCRLKVGIHCHLRQSLRHQ